MNQVSFDPRLTEWTELANGTWRKRFGDVSVYIYKAPKHDQWVLSSIGAYIGSFSSATEAKAFAELTWQ